MKAFTFFLKRFSRAARLRLLWVGTSRFELPSRLVLNSKKFTISAPGERSLAWVFRDIFLDDEYGVLAMADAPPKKILDIGGNIGLFSLFAGASFPDCKVHVYEPNPALIGYLSSNITQIGASVFPEGVARLAGFCSVEDPTQSICGRALPADSGGIPLTPFSVAVERLGGWVDLVKIDCEGAEWDIMDDVESFSCVSSVRLEYHLLSPDHTVQRMVEKMRCAGLTLTKLIPNQGFGIAWFDRLEPTA